MLYNAVRRGVQLLTKQFFSSFKQVGAASVEHGSLLVVSNHPNYLFDPLVINTAFSRRLLFLAKSTLFDNPVLGPFLRWARVVPVYRRQDDPSQSGQNVKSFEKVVEVLAVGEAVVIFPEGLSKINRKLSPLKTGAARMCFQAESAHNFSLDLCVQAAGITYTAPHLFRSSVTVALSEPFRVADLRSDYEDNDRSAVEVLTNKIEELLRSVTVEVADSNQSQLVDQISKLYASAGYDTDDHQRIKTVAENVAKVLPEQPSSHRESLEARLQEYLELVGALGLDFEESLERPLDPVFSVLATPLVLLGILVNKLPYFLTGRLAQRMSGSLVEIASKKLVIGLGVFAGWYLALSLVVLWFSGSWVIALCCLLMLVLLGWLTNTGLQRIRLFLLSCLWPGVRAPVRVVRALRDELIHEFDELRVR